MKSGKKSKLRFILRVTIIGYTELGCVRARPYRDAPDRIENVRKP
jgi:hypothetical protein